MSTQTSPMIIRDVDGGGFVWANRPFEERLGVSIDELADAPLMEWIPDADQARIRCLVDAGNGRITTDHRGAGATTIRLEWELRREGHGVVAIGVEEGYSTAAVSRAEAQLGTRLPSEHSPVTLKETLRAMARIIEEQHPGRRCSILLLDAAQRCVSVGAGPSLPEDYNAAVEGLEIGPFVGSCGTAAYWNQPITVEDIQNEGLWRDLKEHAAKAGVAACWSHPIATERGEVLGALALYNSVPSAPSEYEVRGLRMAARMVGLAIERGRAEEALRDSEAALRKSEERYRIQYENNPTMYFTVDPLGQVINVNQYGASCLGYEAAELIGRPVADVFHEEDRTAATQHLKRCLVESGRALNWELRKTRKDGSMLWVHETARAVVGPDGRTVVLIVCEDITARRQALNLVELQSSVLESVARGVELPSVLDALCRRIEQHVPDSRCLVLLLDETDETLRVGAAPSLPESLRSALNGMTAETSRGTCGAAVFAERQIITDDIRTDSEWETTRELAEECGLRASWSTPLRSSSGAVLGTISICRTRPGSPSEQDQQVIKAASNLAGIATERRREEAALRRTQKLESLGLMAGGVAHDFNNLLVVMLGQSSLALAKMRAQSEARSHVGKVIRAAEQASDLTRQLLAYSGRGHFEIGPLDINTAIEENLHLLDVATPKQVHLTTRLDPSCPPIQADASQLQQVIMNLVMNAAEACEDTDGAIVIRTGRVDLEAGDPRYSSQTDQPVAGGRYALLEVSDTGVGMNAVTLARVFDPFFTTKTTGRGLGLAAVHGIVRGHGGGLAVSSEPGQGTTFSLVFPAGVGVSAEAPRQTRAEPIVPRSGVVLAIDDEVGVREAITDFLSHADLRVLTAASGAEGVEIYRRRRHEIDLVILDLSMPGMSGEETLDKLREENPAVRVLLSSGYNETEVARRFVGKRLAGFIQKPYRPGTLIRRVFQLLPDG